MNSFELFFSAFDATLKNLQINTCTTKYTSTKKVHATYVILLFFELQEDPPQNAYDPFFFRKLK